MSGFLILRRPSQNAETGAAGVQDIMNYILFDDSTRDRLLPFTHTRPMADIRCGIFTMRERWERLLGSTSSTLTRGYLQGVYPLTATRDNIMVNGRIFADAAICEAIARLEHGQKLISGELLIAARTSMQELDAEDLLPHNFDEVKYEGTVHKLEHVWDIFALNDRAVRDDYAMLMEQGAETGGHYTDFEAVTTLGNNIYVEEGAKIGAGCIINTNTGPVYIGRNAEILEGTMIRGPLALCEQAVVKMGAKIYGATTIGPGCKVGGELNNVVFFANSNKSHDGYLGNAVIGEWCNLGADTNCSNLKNNYDEVKIWDEQNRKAVATGLTFCGLLMGDHSKCGINTMFNTGTVAGVSCNIFGAGYQEKFIPSFCWGGPEGMTTYSIDRAIETANRMMERRGKRLNAAEQELMRHIFEHTAEQRGWFVKS